MLNFAKVKPNTYAWQFVTDLHNSIFFRSRDLMLEYKKYYHLEYDTFEEFLFWRYGIQENFFDGITKNLENGLFLLVFEDKLEMGEQFELMIQSGSFLSILDGDNENKN